MRIKVKDESAKLVSTIGLIVLASCSGTGGSTQGENQDVEVATSDDTETEPDLDGTNNDVQTDEVGDSGGTGGGQTGDVETDGEETEGTDNGSSTGASGGTGTSGGTGATGEAGDTGPECHAEESQDCVDGDIYWFDSCGKQGEISEECGTAKICRASADGSVGCECQAHWTGEQCQNCPGNWDSAQDCAVCLPGFEGDDCQTQCIRYVRNSGEAGDGRSWDTAFLSIQDAVDSAGLAVALDQVHSCQVWIGEGLYYIYQDEQTDTIALHPNVHVYGGFAGNETDIAQRDLSQHETILDGTGGDDPVLVNHVASIVQGAHESSLNALTIQHGGLPGRSDSGIGGAGLNAVDSTMEISQCRFINNSTENDGGGIYAERSKLEIRDSEFSENDASSGSAIHAVESELSVFGSKINHNKTTRRVGLGTVTLIESSAVVDTCEAIGNTVDESGGFVYGSKVELSIIDSVVASNDTIYGGGGGIYIVEDSKVHLEGTMFERNDSNRDGGAIWQKLKKESELTVESCVFVGNDAFDNGGVIYAWGSGENYSGKVRLTNCTFERNIASQDGGVLFTNQNHLRIEGNTFVGNESGHSSKTDTGIVSVSEVTDLLVERNLFVGNYIERGDGAAISIFRSSGSIIGNTFAEIHGNSIWISDLKLPISVVNNILSSREGDTSVYTTSRTEQIEDHLALSHNLMSEDSMLDLGSGNILGSPEYVDMSSFNDVDARVTKEQSGKGDGRFVLKDQAANWIPGELEGLFVRVISSVSQPSDWHIITRNTENTLDVFRADANSTGSKYEIYDFHLAPSSPCIDAGYGNLGPETDFDGNPRVDVVGVENTGYGDIDYYDIGAYEYQPPVE